MYSLIRQQKALLAITSEQMQMIELEQRLADAEAARRECQALSLMLTSDSHERPQDHPFRSKGE
jgi:hypothetical protein